MKQKIILILHLDGCNLSMYLGAIQISLFEARDMTIQIEMYVLFVILDMFV